MFNSTCPCAMWINVMSVKRCRCRVIIHRSPCVYVLKWTLFIKHFVLFFIIVEYYWRKILIVYVLKWTIFINHFVLFFIYNSRVLLKENTYCHMHDCDIYICTRNTSTTSSLRPILSAAMIFVHNFNRPAYLKVFWKNLKT